MTKQISQELRKIIRNFKRKLSTAKAIEYAEIYRRADGKYEAYFTYKKNVYTMRDEVALRKESFKVFYKKVILPLKYKIREFHTNLSEEEIKEFEESD